MARLSKKAKREWALFISPKIGRRTYNDLCRKCRNDIAKLGRLEERLKFLRIDIIGIF